MARAGAPVDRLVLLEPEQALRARPPPHDPIVDPVERYMNHVVIRGTPERVARQDPELRETIGLDYLMCAPLSHQSFMLFTEKVLPKLL